MQAALLQQIQRELYRIVLASCERRTLTLPLPFTLDLLLLRPFLSDTIPLIYFQKITIPET
jgi:hypothetical protein